MTRLHKYTYCCCLSLLFLLCLPQVTLASNLLKPFSVDYKLYKGGISIARITVTLQQQDGEWLWRSDMRPASWYSLFSDNRSFNKTRFAFEQPAPRLKRIELGEKAGEQLVESATFDWTANRLMIERKGKTGELAIQMPVYDYQSIHLLAAEMQQSKQDSKQVNFYRNGRLTTATMRRDGRTVLDYGAKSQQAEMFTFTRANSEAVLTYYYAPGEPLYPIRVEHSEPDNSGFIIILQPDKT